MVGRGMPKTQQGSSAPTLFEQRPEKVLHPACDHARNGIQETFGKEDEIGGGRFKGEVPCEGPERNCEIASTNEGAAREAFLIA